MNILVRRIVDITEKTCLGIIFLLNHKFFCIIHQKLIPGVYNIKFVKSGKFESEKILIYNDVIKEERKILIHPGNFSKETEGCLLVGTEYSFEDSMLKNSVYAVNLIEKLVLKHKIETLIIQ